MRGAVYICPPNVPAPGPCRGKLNPGWPKKTAEAVAACPHEAEHSYGPENMMASWDWSEETEKHWKHVKCACEMFLIIVPRRGSRRPKPDALAAQGYRPDGTWSCVRDHRRTPCRDCIPCKVIMAVGPEPVFVVFVGRVRRAPATQKARPVA